MVPFSKSKSKFFWVAVFSVVNTWDFHKFDRYSVNYSNIIAYGDLLPIYASAITCADGAKYTVVVLNGTSANG